MKKIFCSLLLAASLATTQAQTLSMTTEEKTPGKEWTLSLQLDGATAYSALSINLSLPDGVALSATEGGNLLTDEHQLVTGTRNDGSLMLIVYSMQSSTLATTSGTIATLSLCAQDTLAKGSYDISTLEVCLSDPKGTETILDNTKGTLVSTYEEKVDAVQGVTLKNNTRENIYNLQGVQLKQIPRRGIYIYKGSKKTVR